LYIQTYLQLNAHILQTSSNKLLLIVFYAIRINVLKS